MLRVYTCIVHEHDLRSLIIAALICLLAAFTTFLTVEQARRATRYRLPWLVGAGFVSGMGIWSTHFVAMLAYEPGLPIGYDLPLTALSIIAAMVISGVGWSIMLRPERWVPLVAGAVIGSSIFTMHYIGMSAVKMAGVIIWDSRLVAASVVIAIALSTAAIVVRRHRTRHIKKLPWPAALLFMLAICGMHFTAMGAARIFPDPYLTVPQSAIGSTALTIAVAMMAFLIIAVNVAVVFFDRKLASHAAEEAQRLKAFADAATEGLVVIDGDRVVDANRSFLTMSGHASAQALPERLNDLFPEFDPARQKLGPDARAKECRLIAADGSEIDVEVLLRPLNWRGAERRVLAIRDISERREAAARIAHLAYHDTLTGLPNRTVFTEHLARTVERAEAAGEPVAVLCLDLDGFKAVNDLQGHPSGDTLLIAVSQRLRNVTRSNELVARLGADEFVIVQQGGDQPGHAGLLAERVLSALSAPFALDQGQARISAGVGVALFPADATNPVDLIKNADLALCRAKAEGRGLVRFYEAAMDEALRQRRQLEADLRVAVGTGALNVHYQPLADLESGSIFGFEALLRWTHPQLGPISPDIFIRLAEESGLIFKLGEWVLREACAEAARWNPPLKLAVNLSPVQFTQDGVVEMVERVLRDTNLEPGRLDLEVTEGLLIKDAAGALATLERLKALGVRISMDDFGTGYSSLSYFRMFPFDKVKIDRSFVQDISSPQSRAIVRSVIGLGHGLGVPVLAEGVETPEQLDALRSEGCDQVQGYLIARPNPIGHFEGVVLDREGNTPVAKLAPARRKRA